MSNLGFGFANPKVEGSPVNPDELDWECDLDLCEDCRYRYEIQKAAYEAYWNNRKAETPTVSEV